MFQFVSKLNVRKEEYQINRKIQHYDIDLSKAFDENTKFRGSYSNKYDFVVIYLTSCIGFGNLINFPKLSYNHGGMTFIIMYLILSVAFSIPIFLIESGLSQFYSVGESKVFRVVPYFTGLGWSILLTSLIIFIPYCVIIGWCLQYLFASFPFRKPPWRSCSIKVPTFHCVELIKKSRFNLSKNEMHPSELYYEFEVIGSRKRIDGSLYTFDEALIGMYWYQFLMIFVVWLLIGIFAVLISKVYVKFIYVLLAISVLILLSLTINALNLPGSFKGITMFLKPNLSKVFTAEGFKSAMSQLMFSLCITKGVLSFASLNDFKYNFLKASYLVIFGDFMYSIVGGIFLFSTLGYLSQYFSVDIKNLTESNLIFINFIDSRTLGSEKELWTFFFMLMLIINSVGTVGVTCGAFTISFIDFFPNFVQKSQIKKTLIGVGLCSVLCFSTMFFAANGSYLYLDAFTRQTNDICSPIMMLFEVIVIHGFYGQKRLRLECKMMLGFSYNIIWVILPVTFVPLSTLFVLFYTYYAESPKDLPLWSVFMSNFVPVFVVSPLIVYFFLQTIRSLLNTRNIYSLVDGFHTPEIYGPYYKYNWLLSRYYQMKLVKVRNNPKFIATIHENEDVDEVLTMLKKTHKKAKRNARKQRKKMDKIRNEESRLSEKN